MTVDDELVDRVYEATLAYRKHKGYMCGPSRGDVKLTLIGLKLINEAIDKIEKKDFKKVKVEEK